MNMFSISPQCYDLFISHCHIICTSGMPFQRYEHLLLTCYVQFFRRSRLKMELPYFINLILIFSLNVFFFFSGICLNSLAILTFWRSVQLRKKLCYFMIMVLSCCDLLVVLNNHTFTALIAMLWLTRKLNVYPKWADIFFHSSAVLHGFSLLALLVMNFDRYLATYYPIFHRTSLTKGKYLTLFATLIVVELTVSVMSINEFLICGHTSVAIFLIILIPPMLFFNYKLFKIARNKRKSPEMKKSFSFKTISSCLLAVACLVVVSIPMLVYIGLRTNTGYSWTLDNANIAALWGETIASINSTFNCLIFYWKNKILRIEAMKVIKGLRIRRKDQS